jgi:hypothetical protein
MLQSKAIIYILAAVFSLSIVSSIVNNVKDYFKEPTYTKDAIELMIKHDRLKQEIKKLEIDNQIIEKDNERLKHNITSDSITIYDSSRAYRDSLRAVLFAN